MALLQPKLFTFCRCELPILSQSLQKQIIPLLNSPKVTTVIKATSLSLNKFIYRPTEFPKLLDVFIRKLKFSTKKFEGWISSRKSIASVCHHRADIFHSSENLFGLKANVLCKTHHICSQGKTVLSRQQTRYIHHSSYVQNRRDGFAHNLNPLLGLQPFLQVPVLEKNENIFHPTPSDVNFAQLLFTHSPRNKNSIELLKRAVKFEDFPESEVPEVAFLGRSNVGKSALLKELFSEALHEDSKLYHYISTSKKPGHTRKLNFYRVGDRFTLVDMPGYGFHMPTHFVNTVEAYLQSRAQLQMSFLLVDGETGLSSTDQVGIEMMEEFGKPYVIVLTKIDKTSPHKLIRTLFELKKVKGEKMKHSFPQMFMVSSKSGAGIEFLRTFIAYISGQLPSQVEP